MNRTDILAQINDTIITIQGCCTYATDSQDASYIANNIEMWLDQLRREIEEYDDADEEEEEEDEPYIYYDESGKMYCEGYIVSDPMDV